MSNLLLKAGTLIVGDGKTLENVSILIQGEKIAEVGQDITPPPDTEVLDFSDRVVMPGIIDPHVHVCYDGAPNPEEVRLMSD
ncbi:MAG: hypothetical protein ACTSWA_12140, partial [Candidatus Thorarchaeota archaeon]